MICIIKKKIFVIISITVFINITTFGTTAKTLDGWDVYKEFTPQWTNYTTEISQDHTDHHPEAEFKPDGKGRVYTGICIGNCNYFAKVKLYTSDDINDFKWTKQDTKARIKFGSPSKIDWCEMTIVEGAPATLFISIGVIVYSPEKELIKEESVKVVSTFKKDLSNYNLDDGELVHEFYLKKDYYYIFSAEAIAVTTGEYGAEAKFSFKNLVLEYKPEGDISPTVTISKPKNSVYMINKEIIDYPLPLIIGNISVKGESNDNSGIKKMEIYIEDQLRESTNNEHIKWNWNDNTMDLLNLTIKATDNSENTNTKTIECIYLNPWGEDIEPCLIVEDPDSTGVEKLYSASTSLEISNNKFTEVLNKLKPENVDISFRYDFDWGDGQTNTKTVQRTSCSMGHTYKGLKKPITVTITMIVEINGETYDDLSITIEEETGKSIYKFDNFFFKYFEKNQFFNRLSNLKSLLLSNIKR